MLHYDRIGNGEKLVLIHGFLGDCTIFNPIMGELQDHFDMIRIDLPGHGKSAVEKSSYSIYDYVEAISNILKKERIVSATWLGHSMGGYIVLAALQKKTPSIEKAILAYTSTSADTAEAQKKRATQQQNIIANGVRPFVDNVMPAFFAPHAQDKDIEFAKQIGYRANENGLIIALEAMKTRQDQTELLNTATTPILIFEGTQDNIVKPINTDNIVVQKIITNTGHLGMIEEPDAFTSGIKQFLL
ncbi:alpha/beta fold hydrolase [Lysinibacillus sp. 54212]|uniref:alpha/beta fold hydrolase n=1 Tax=Lysinibacillus sp. 54212 TaxID=3119829 RepID=UPI002FC9A505